MFSRFRQIFNIFSKKERWTFLGAAALFLIAAIWLTASFVKANTVLKPIDGGEYAEGKVGQPSFINPVISSNSESDQDLIRLLFSDVNDLRDGDIETDTGGKVWKLRIKGDINWQDGQPITSDDIVFTIKAIQDSDLNSPLFSDWQGVKTERISAREVKLVLSGNYVFFKNTLLNLRPIPKHIFADVPFANMRLSDYNLINPVGSGPFKFLDLKKRRDGFITDYELVKNDYYFAKKPYLDKITFKFYAGEDDAIKAFNSGAIDGLGLLQYKNLDKITVPDQIYAASMPRYYAIFFNQSAGPVLKNPSVRTALEMATDKAKIVARVFKSMAVPLTGPLAPGIEGYDEKTFDQQNDFSPEKANAILNSDGWLASTNGIRENPNPGGGRLEFTLTLPDISFLTDTAKLIQDDWSKIGVKLNLDLQPSDRIFTDKIKPRDYEMLLFGNIYGENPDLFSFWHSSQKFHPGLNLALYENKDVDFLINSVQNDFNPVTRRDKMIQTQSFIKNDQPAIFLFSPSYIYILNKSIMGFNENFLYLPSSRFEHIENWYTKTERIFK